MKSKFKYRRHVSFLWYIFFKYRWQGKAQLFSGNTSPLGQRAVKGQKGEHSMLERQRDQGFTLIELLLVVVIIGILLAVIVPRAWRANTDAKYGLVRQSASELASWGNLWAEQQMEAADEQRSTATMFNYLRTLTGPTSEPGGQAIDWVARDTNTNWTERTDDNLIAIVGRAQGTIEAATGAPPENSVAAIVPVEKVPRNPFNGISVFQSGNDPNAASTPIPGALACGWQVDTSRGGEDSTWAYFGFVFQGTDSTSISLGTGDAGAPDTFLAGQDRDLEGLRNGIFFARVPFYSATITDAD